MADSLVPSIMAVMRVARNCYDYRIIKEKVPPLRAGLAERKRSEGLLADLLDLGFRLRLAVAVALGSTSVGNGQEGVAEVLLVKTEAVHRLLVDHAVADHEFGGSLGVVNQGVQLLGSGDLFIGASGAVGFLDLLREGSKEGGADLRFVGIDEAESVAVARLRRERADIEADFLVLGNEIADGFSLLNHGV